MSIEIKTHPSDKYARELGIGVYAEVCPFKDCGHDTRLCDNHYRGCGFYQLELGERLAKKRGIKLRREESD